MIANDLSIARVCAMHCIKHAREKTNDAFSRRIIISNYRELTTLCIHFMLSRCVRKRASCLRERCVFRTRAEEIYHSWVTNVYWLYTSPFGKSMYLMVRNLIHSAKFIHRYTYINMYIAWSTDCNNARECDTVARVTYKNKTFRNVRARKNKTISVQKNTNKCVHHLTRNNLWSISTHVYINNT